MRQRVNNRVSCLTPCQPDGMERFRKRGQCLGHEEGGHAGMGALPHLPPMSPVSPWESCSPLWLWGD